MPFLWSLPKYIPMMNQVFPTLDREGIPVAQQEQVIGYIHDIISFRLVIETDELNHEWNVIVLFPADTKIEVKVYYRFAIPLR